MSIVTTRAQRREMERQNKKMPLDLQPVPEHEWPIMNGRRPTRVWRSRNFLVQEYAAISPALVRLSVSRTTLSGDRWADNIEWDELQWIKRQCGYAHHEAVEIYPPDKDVVNVANMRHLWVLEAPTQFAWRRGSA